MIKILLAEKQPLMLAGITAFLAGLEGIQISEVVNARDELFTRIQNNPVAVLLVDMDALGVSADDLKGILASFPDLRIVVLSGQLTDSFINEVIRSGVNGFLTMDCDQHELIHAIRIVAKGERYYCQQVLNAIIQTSLQPPKSTPVQNSLTAREAELLKLIARGYSNQKAAEVMNLSPHTVHTHRKKISRKLNIKSPTEFLVHALDLGLVELTSKM